MPPRLLRYARKEQVLLQRNSAHSFAASHALACYQSDAIYTYIPKNGCSTLRLSLAIANGCVAGPEDVIWIHANNPTFVASLRDLARARFTFTVLRCPFSRLASVFLDKILSRRPEYWALDRLENDQLDPATLSFRAFVDLLSAPRRIKANVHWRPQIDFLVYETYDAYFAFEDFAAAAEGIEAGAGIEVVDARPLTRHGTDRFTLETEGCFADTPLAELDEMRRGGRLPAHAALYDDALSAQVAGLYATDIRLYSRKLDAAGLMFPAQARKGK